MLHLLVARIREPYKMILEKRQVESGKEAREAILSIQVDAGLTGHDLGQFAPMESLTEGYTALQ